MAGLKTPSLCLPVFLSLCLLFSSCRSAAYREYYSYLKTPPAAAPFNETDNFVVFLVEARHLDYTDGRGFLRSMAKHPSDGSKNSDVGHSWVLLKTPCFVWEGGHSGETGEGQPRYFEGVALLAESGDENPIRYLWAIQKNGFLEAGSGDHFPSFAVKFDITEEQAAAIQNFLRSYPYENYSMSHNCCTLVAEVGRIIGLDLETEVAIYIPESVQMGSEAIPLRRCEDYSVIRVSSPDRLEKSLRESEGEAALDWYKSHYYCPWPKKIDRCLTDFKLLPRRTVRFLECW